MDFGSCRRHRHIDAPDAFGLLARSRRLMIAHCVSPVRGPHHILPKMAYRGQEDLCPSWQPLPDYEKYASSTSQQSTTSAGVPSWAELHSLLATRADDPSKW